MVKIRFDTSFVGVDKERRARHGMPWTSHDYDRLKDLFQKGSSLKTAAAQGFRRGQAAAKQEG